MFSLAGDDAIKERVKATRGRYSEVLCGEGLEITLVAEGERLLLSRKEVFEHWLYGLTFHQQASRQAVLQQLQARLADFFWQVHGTASELAKSILQLGAVVADFLGESHLKQAALE